MAESTCRNALRRAARLSSEETMYQGAKGVCVSALHVDLRGLAARRRRPRHETEHAGAEAPSLHVVSGAIRPRMSLRLLPESRRVARTLLTRTDRAPTWPRDVTRTTVGAPLVAQNRASCSFPRSGEWRSGRHRGNQRGVRD
jgi:hypothetical protein